MSDFDDEELGDLAHPADRKQGPFFCDYPDCDKADYPWANYKVYTLHITGSHRDGECKYCGESSGLRGLSSHEAACKFTRSKRFDDMLPTDAIRARLKDWMGRADEAVVRDDVYCVVCQEGESADPEFVRDIAVAQRIKGRGPCWVFPANLITPELFIAAPIRDRRTGLAEKKHREPGQRFEPTLTIDGDE